jgi:hypothetical protein
LPAKSPTAILLRIEFAAYGLAADQTIPAAANTLNFWLLSSSTICGRAVCFARATAHRHQTVDESRRRNAPISPTPWAPIDNGRVRSYRSFGKVSGVTSEGFAPLRRHSSIDRRNEKNDSSVIDTTPTVDAPRDDRGDF